MTDETPEVFEALGWHVEVDPLSGEIRVEHDSSGGAYVFDTEGNVTIPGDVDVGGELRDLQATLAATLDAAGNDLSNVASVEGEGGSVEFEEGPDGLVLDSDQAIRIDAPKIELTGGEIELSGSTVSVSSDGGTTVDAAGPLTLEGAIIQLN